MLSLSNGYFLELSAITVTQICDYTKTYTQSLDEMHACGLHLSKKASLSLTKNIPFQVT